MKTNYIKMRSLIFSFLTLFLCQHSLCSYAHEGHAHPLEKNEIIDRANKVIIMAVDQKKLEPSWKEAKMIDAKMLETKESGQWLVQYNNPKITNNDKDLYIFFSLDGKYIAMNHTGK